MVTHKYLFAKNVPPPAVVCDIEVYEFTVWAASLRLQSLGDVQTWTRG